MKLIFFEKNPLLSYLALKFITSANQVPILHVSEILETPILIYPPWSKVTKESLLLLNEYRGHTYST